MGSLSSRATFRDTSSTAGIGTITIPMLMYPLVAGVLAIDRLLSARQLGEPVLQGLIRRLFAVGIAFVVVVAALFTFVGVVSLFDPVTRDNLAESLLVTVLSALVAAAGAVAIRRLWRVAPMP